MIMINKSLVQEAMRTAKHCLYNDPLSTTKLQDYTQASRSRSYTYRKTLPLQSSPVHNETARLHPGLSFQKLYVPQNTTSTIIPCPQRNCETKIRPFIQEPIRTTKNCPTIIPFQDENSLYLPSGLIWF
ncbi:hypothetical protein J6590_079980 [Homalodisca vitripennis]|nr:hypothetical protein J6590_079980 [Homalodisca vitripennis]